MPASTPVPAGAPRSIAQPASRNGRPTDAPLAGVSTDMSAPGCTFTVKITDWLNVLVTVLCAYATTE
jgi:hypothetical protein